MSELIWKLVGIGLAVFLLLVLVLVLGAGGGAWLAAGHYRPLLDAAQDDLGKAAAARDNLVALTTEQGVELGKLAKAGKERQERAAQAMATAKEDAKPDYAAANRIQQEHTGGDPATAAASIIDQELGL